MNAVDRALRDTGFVGPDGKDVDGLRRRHGPGSFKLEAAFSRRTGLLADAVYETDDGPKLVVRSLSGDETPGAVRALQERAWNLGLAPLLWFVTPVEVRVYDAYRGVGEEGDDAPLQTYRLDVTSEMDALDAFCGRFSLDTGAFWASDLAARIDRSQKVDRVLLEEIAALEDLLVAATPDGKTDLRATRGRCQELVICTLFALYLLERGIAIPPGFSAGDDHDLALTYRSREETLELFRWLHGKFNGDVFPENVGDGLHADHLPLLEDFVRGTGLAKRRKGQYRLFRFRFDVLPAELISSVYEAFARRAAAADAKRLGLHYTPIDLVNMALDPVFEGLPAEARILDMTCGSGLFLVEALRRLVWMKCGDRPRPRSVVRKALYEQVFGVDIEPAALRIAAFGLYLAALELETCADEGEATRFLPLIGRTLQCKDFLSEETVALVRGLGIDAIVGNPPWTHVKGIVGKRKDESLGARRSPDHAFVTAAVGILGSSGRISLYLKATPLFSRALEATRFREFLLRGLDRLALLSLAALRHEKLFPDAEAPGLLLCANCGVLPDAGLALVGAFPWTSDFKRSGSLALSSADVRAVSKDRLLEFPSALKTSMIGTPRDALLMERIESGFGTLDDLAAAWRVTIGQGFQVKSTTRKTKAVPLDIARLPALFPADYAPVDLKGVRLASLEERGITSLLYARTRSLYRAPLVVFPKSRHEVALQQGRTSAVLLTCDTAFSHGFYGLSFADSDARLATVLCAILNSAVTAYQFLFGAGALGLERPSILPQDLRAIRMPPIELDDGLAAAARQALDAAPIDGCAALDSFAAGLYGLGPDERDLVRDAVRRGRSTFLDSAEARVDDASAPASHDMVEYSDVACRSVNAVLRFGGRRRLVATYQRSEGGSDPLDRFAAVRFEIRSGARSPEAASSAAVGSLLEGIRDRLATSPTPYLKERRSVRVYVPDAVTVVKPAQRRYWTVAAALQDADAIISDHWPKRT